MKKALITALDQNPAIRAALMKRLLAALENKPVALIHLIVTMLESDI